MIEHHLALTLLWAPETFVEVRDWLTASMFSQPVPRGIMDQFYACWDLHRDGLAPAPFPSLSDVLSVVPAKDFTQAIRQFGGFVDSGLPSMRIRPMVLLLFEFNIRDTVRSWLEPIRVQGVAMTSHLNQISDTSLDVFEACSAIQQSLVLVDQQPVADKIKTLTSRLDSKMAAIRKAETAAQLVMALKRLSQTDPACLLKYTPELQAITTEIQSATTRKTRKQPNSSKP